MLNALKLLNLLFLAFLRTKKESAEITKHEIWTQQPSILSQEPFRQASGESASNPGKLLNLTKIRSSKEQKRISRNRAQELKRTALTSRHCFYQQATCQVLLNADKLLNIAHVWPFQGHKENRHKLKLAAGLNLRTIKPSSEPLPLDQLLNVGERSGIIKLK